MKDTAYTQVNPLVRVAEMKLLSKIQFEQMLQAKDFAGAIGVLKGTSYAPYLEQNPTGSDFNQFLVEEQSKTFHWAYDLSSERHLIDLYTLRYTYHNLKLLTKAKLTKQNLDQYFIDEGRFSLQKLKVAIDTQQADQMPLFMLEGIHEVQRYFEEHQIIQAVDIIYDRYYVNHLRQSAEKLGYPDILADIIHFIDLLNLSTLIRGVIEHRSEAFMTTVLSSSGSILKKNLLQLCGRSLSEVTTALLATACADEIRLAIDEKHNQVDSIRFDRIKDNALGRLFERGHFQAFGPLPLLGYLNAKEMEITNLRLVLVGKKNHFEPEQVKERMRLTYVS